MFFSIGGGKGIHPFVGPFICFGQQERTQKRNPCIFIFLFLEYQVEFVFGDSLGNDSSETGWTGKILSLRYGMMVHGTRSSGAFFHGTEWNGNICLDFHGIFLHGNERYRIFRTDYHWNCHGTISQYGFYRDLVFGVTFCVADYGPLRMNTLLCGSVVRLKLYFFTHPRIGKKKKKLPV